MTHKECHGRALAAAYLLVFICVSIFFSACGYSSESFIAKGEELLKKRKYHDAMMQFRSAVEADPNSAGAHWGLARAHESLGNFNESVDELRRTVDLDGANLDAKVRLGNYFLLVQPPLMSESVKLRDQVVAANPKFIEGHILTATILMVQGKPEQDVLNALNNAIAVDPKRAEPYISLERYFVSRNKIQDAENALKKGISESPESPLAYVEYGRFLMYASRDRDAEPQFQKAISLDPSNVDSYEAAAEFYTTSQQWDKAEKQYFKIIELLENSPESRLELATYYQAAGKEQQAVGILENILAETPEFALARYRLGEIYLSHNDIAKVSEQLDALFRINDSDSRALILRSRMRMKQNQPEEAIKDLEEVLKKEPSAKEPLFLMAEARQAAGQTDQANAFIADLERYHPTYLKTSLLKIQAAFAAGDPQTALKVSNELITKATSTTPNPETEPNSLHELRLRGLTSRGLAYLDLGKFNEARTDLREMVRLSPRPASLVNLAKVSVAQRNYQEALGIYQDALSKDAKYFDAIGGFVNSSIRLGKYDLALEKTNELMKVNNGDAELVAAVHYLRSSIYSAQKNDQSAESELLASITADQNYLPAYTAYADLLQRQNRTQEAVDQYQKLLQKRPSAQVYTLLGILEDSRNNAGGAETSYRKALEMAPDSTIAANNLAWLLAENGGNLDEALQFATLAVTKNPTVAGFYDTLGWVYLKKGLPYPAVEKLKKAVALDETNSKRTGSKIDPAYRERLGIALARAGERASAKNVGLNGQS